MSAKKTFFCDFDGTLAHYAGWKGYRHLGDPIPAMVTRVKKWLARGDRVVIFTARITPWDPKDLPRGIEQTDPAEAVRLVQDWCEAHLGQRLEVTNVKGGWTDCYDDHIHRVVRNTGRTVEEHVLALIEEETAAARIFCEPESLNRLNRLYDKVAAL